MGLDNSNGSSPAENYQIKIHKLKEKVQAKLDAIHVGDLESLLLNPELLWKSMSY